MTPRPAPARKSWRLGAGAFVARPKLVISMALGAAAGGVALLLPDSLASSAAIIGWDVFCLLYLGLIFHALRSKGPDQIRARAAQEDEGQAVILAVIIAASVASVVAVAMELSLAREARGLEQAIRIGAAFGTVTASWLLMQVVFALHYAHEFYATDRQTGKDAGGLAFPGVEPPDYWDFLHFAIVIGVAAQTADIAFTSPALRRLGTWHSLIAFAFNTLIVALTINLVAGLF